MTHPFFAGGQLPRIFGHRGFVPPHLAAAGTLENSRTAIAAAIAAGTDYIESDCRLTRDREPVLFHDATLLRTLGDPRTVAAVTLAELRHLMGDRGGLITLEEALLEFPAARFNLDIKTADAAVTCGSIIGRIAPERTLITSFSDRTRELALAAAGVAARRVVGESQVQMRETTRPATSAGQRTVLRILAAVALGATARATRLLTGIDALQIPEHRGPIRVLTPALLRAAHANGVEVHVWTVNDPVHMRALVARGVDGIVTDRTDIAVRALRA